MLDMERTLTGKALLTNTIGLHARPSVKLTQLAKRFQSSIQLALGEAGVAEAIALCASLERQPSLARLIGLVRAG